MKPIAPDELERRRLLTRAEVREIDRRAIEDFGIPGIVLMENAGRGAAEIIRQTCDLKRGSVAIVCGGGNNGGDGMVIARHLSIWGVAVRVLIAADITRFTGDALTQLKIIQRMKLPMRPFFATAELERSCSELAGADVIVDAVLGTGFSGSVRPPLDAVIEAINAARPAARVVAIDLPSGLDCDTGNATGPAVAADVTVTFVAPKSGFRAKEARPFLGELFVVDIGAPLVI